MLKTKIKQKFLGELNSIPAFKVLIVDEEALFLLDNSVKMHEVLQQNITAVEGLFKNRRSQPQTACLYLISNSLRSVQQVIQDFHSGTIYKEIHIICTGFLSDSLFDKLKQSSVKSHIRTCKELGIDFIAFQDSFSVEMPSIQKLYNPETESLKQYQLKLMARKIASVLGNLDEVPYIRYQSKPVTFQSKQPKTLCSELANYVDQEIKGEKTKTTLLILDRKSDVITPFVHDLHYQSLLSDLLGLHCSKVSAEGKEYKLDEEDDLYTEFQNMHIGDALEGVTLKFNKFMSENEAAKFQQQGGSASIEQLKNVVVSMDSFGKTKEAFAKHVTLCNNISSVFEKRGLEFLVDLEQQLVLSDIDSSKFSKLLKELDNAIQDPQYEHLDIVRLVFLIVLQKEGITDSERRKYLDMARFSREENRALTNLSYFEVSLGPNGRENRNPYSISQNAARNRDEPYQMENARYLPALYFIVKDMLEEQLDHTWYPYLGKKPEAGLGTSSVSGGWARKKPNWATRREDQPEAVSKKNRFIIFVIGGFTTHEQIACKKLSDKYGVEIICGGNLIWSPDSFIEALKGISEGGDEHFYGYKRPTERRPSHSQSDRQANLPARAASQEKPKKSLFGRSKKNVSERSSGRASPPSPPLSGRSGSRGNIRDHREDRSSSRRPGSSGSGSREGINGRGEGRPAREIQPKETEKKGWFRFNK